MQIRRTICTSVSLRTSTRISPGFILSTLSSPSFGSHHICSNSTISSDIRSIMRERAPPPLIRFAFASPFCFSHRPEATHLGDLMRLSVRLGSMQFNSSRFSRIVHSTPDTSKGDVLLQSLTTFLRVKRFEGPRAVSKKR